MKDSDDFGNLRSREVEGPSIISHCFRDSNKMDCDHCAWQAISIGKEVAIN